MTEGLRIDFKGSDLIQLFNERSELNEKRAQDCMDKWQIAKPNLPAQYAGEYQKSYEDQSAHYIRRAHLFRLLSERLKSNEVYVLSGQDFIAIDMLDMPVGAMMMPSPNIMPIR